MTEPQASSNSNRNLILVALIVAAAVVGYYFWRHSTRKSSAVPATTLGPPKVVRSQERCADTVNDSGNPIAAIEHHVKSAAECFDKCRATYASAASCQRVSYYRGSTMNILTDSASNCVFNVNGCVNDMLSTPTPDGDGEYWNVYSQTAS